MSIHRERDYTQSAAGILDKQRSRVLLAAEALAQHIRFIRPCDWHPEEEATLAFVERFVAERKGPGRENGRTAERERLRA